MTTIFTLSIFKFIEHVLKISYVLFILGLSIFIAYLLYTNFSEVIYCSDGSESKDPYIINIDLETYGNVIKNISYNIGTGIAVYGGLRAAGDVLKTDPMSLHRKLLYIALMGIITAVITTLICKVFYI